MGLNFFSLGIHGTFWITGSSGLGPIDLVFVLDVWQLMDRHIVEHHIDLFDFSRYSFYDVKFGGDME